MASPILWNIGELERILEGPDGPVGLYLADIGRKVANQAKVNASGRPGPNVPTGRLRSSIVWGLGYDVAGLFVDIGTNVYYGEYLETGKLPNGARCPFLEPALYQVTGGGP